MSGHLTCTERLEAQLAVNTILTPDEHSIACLPLFPSGTLQSPMEISAGTPNMKVVKAVNMFVGEDGMGGQLKDPEEENG